MAHLILKTAIAAVALTGGHPGRAGEAEHFRNAPMTGAAPAMRLAVQYELKLNLPEGGGLARVLVDAGIRQDDAVTAARLAAGHLGENTGGGQAKVSVSRSSRGEGFQLERVTLFTRADQTVIERRRGELAVTSRAANRKYPRLV